MSQLYWTYKPSDEQGYRGHGKDLVKGTRVDARRWITGRIKPWIDHLMKVSIDERDCRIKEMIRLEAPEVIIEHEVQMRDWQKIVAQYGRKYEFVRPAVDWLTSAFKVRPDDEVVDRAWSSYESMRGQGLNQELNRPLMDMEAMFKAMDKTS